MYAIRVKYLPCTSQRPARYKVEMKNRGSLIISTDEAYEKGKEAIKKGELKVLNSETSSIGICYAAQEYCKNWDFRGKFVMFQLNDEEWGFCLPDSTSIDVPSLDD